MIVDQERGLPQAFNNIFQGVSSHLHVPITRFRRPVDVARLGSRWPNWWHFERFVRRSSLAGCWVI